MSQIHHEVVAANAKYAEEFAKTQKGSLPMPPARKFAILTCMDARLDPAGYAGLTEGDAHVIRNAGGRATDDAIRSLVISNTLLGTQEWFVIHHTDCGMLTFDDEKMAAILKEKTGRDDGAYIKWHTIKDLKESVASDVRRIRGHNLTPNDIPVHGYIYDCGTGKLLPVIV